MRTIRTSMFNYKVLKQAGFDVEMVKENEEMTSERLINEIDVMTSCNRQHTRDVNELLCDIRNYLKKIKNQESSEYERGCEDVWVMIRKIFGNNYTGAFGVGALQEIFGCMSPTTIVQENTVQEALAKVEAYEKKKKEEAEKPVVGDVVEYINDGDVRKGILLGADHNWYSVKLTTYDIPQLLSKRDYVLKKTGKHINIQGMLNEIKTED